MTTPDDGAPESAQRLEDAPGHGVLFVVDPRRSIFYRIVRAAIYGVATVMFRPVVKGGEFVPVTGAAILTPVHRSNLDFAFTIFLTKRKLFFMAKDSLWKSSLLGKILTVLGAFPVHRESADRESLERAQEVLEAGQLLVLFPEGTRQEGALVATFHEGASYLAAKTGAPLIPVGIGNTDRAMAKGKKLPRPVKVSIVAHQALPAPQKGPSGRVPRSTVRATTSSLSEAIQGAYDDALGLVQG